MLSIGQFSKACCVSIKTLRHYEKIGLLRPARVDEWTGYRYYDGEQISTMLLIRRLKRYGFSLLEIGRMIDEPQDSRALLAALERQRDVLEGRMEQTAQIIRELETHLSSFERTGDIMDYQNAYAVTLQDVPEQWVLSSRQRMSVREYGIYYGKLYERVAREHIAVDGRSMCVYFDEAFDPENMDAELALGVKDPAQATRAIPGGQMATTVHCGPYSGLSDAYGALTRWMADHGYELAGAPYEVYRRNQFDHLPPEQWETDIFFPVKRKETDRI